MPEALSEQDLKECESALAYVHDMSEWFDAEAEGDSRLDYALRILDQIDRRGSLSRAQLAWCEQRLRDEME